MAKPVTHLSRIRQLGDRTITGTICNRMTGNGDINCTTDAAEVTCKLCLNILSADRRGKALANSVAA
jgi:hypothetical protein